MRSGDEPPDVRSLAGGPPGGSESLLIYGTDDGSAWYATLTQISTGSQAGCYGLSTYNAWDAGDSILYGFPLDTDEGVDTGVLLRKADTWDG